MDIPLTGRWNYTVILVLQLSLPETCFAAACCIPELVKYVVCTLGDKGAEWI